MAVVPISDCNGCWCDEYHMNIWMSHEPHTVDDLVLRLLITILNCIYFIIMFQKFLEFKYNIFY